MTLIAPAEMEKIVRKIAKTDPAFKVVIKENELCGIGSQRPTHSHYETLVTSILSQQLAIKAADTITARVKALVKGRITAERMFELSPDELRAAGVSGAKTRAIMELTSATLNKELHFSKFPKMSNAEISEELTALWGVGRWTVEMFLMFHLGRLDLWPVGDLGVRRGWEKLHQLPNQMKPEELEILGEQFAGYQSVVAWYCWKALDNKKTP